MFRSITLESDYIHYLISALATLPHQGAVDVFSSIVRFWLEYIEPRIGIGHRGGVATSSQPKEPAIRDGSALTFYEHQKHIIHDRIETSQKRTLPLSDVPLHSILYFFVAAARHSMTMRWASLDAGALLLILCALEDGLPLLLSSLISGLKQHNSGERRSNLLSSPPT